MAIVLIAANNPWCPVKMCRQVQFGGAGVRFGTQSRTAIIIAGVELNRKSGSKSIARSSIAANLAQLIFDVCRLVLRGRNKPSILTAQWLAFVSPFERLRHCTIKVFYKV